MKPLAAIILAAGKGTRMGSDLPKVAHPVAGAPMVRWVVDACRGVGGSRLVLVVGHRQEDVRAIFDGHDEEEEAPIEFAEQSPQLGTGHAVMCAQPLLDDFEGDIIVLCGDGPLIRAETLERLVERHRAASAAATLATSTIPDPAGYGRIVREGSGRFVGIVEEKNATPEQKRLREVNPSYYCFDARALFDALRRIERNPASGEYYLTDVPALLLREGKRVEVIDAVPPEDVLSINTPAQLADVDRILRKRLGMMEARV